ncbi:MAG: transposase [Verrucomicrobia bacterium]|jgi:REP element-mobilizing transposase RayT|nr:transposase [Verrucomicrobiota bacterium]
MHLPHVLPFAKSPLYFFTACTAGRARILAAPGPCRVLEEIWRLSAERNGWFVGRFLLMPDHAHFFAMPSAEARARSKWCQLWKSVSSRRLSRDEKLAPPIWQADTFDHILRSAETYAAKWDYVRLNPVRAGLVATADQWPWQGEVHSLAF